MEESEFDELARSTQDSADKIADLEWRVEKLTVIVDAIIGSLANIAGIERPEKAVPSE